MQLTQVAELISSANNLICSSIYCYTHKQTNKQTNKQTSFDTFCVFWQWLREMGGEVPVEDSLETKVPVVGVE